MAYTETAYRARALRNAMTEPEVILWSRLKRLHTQGFQFRRQTPFRGYVLDFVCFARRIAVEVDGGHHNDPAQAAHDSKRDAVLAREGFQVLRFSNSAVRQNLDGVVYSIMMALAEAPVSPPGSRPRREPPSP